MQITEKPSVAGQIRAGHQTLGGGGGRRGRGGPGRRGLQFQPSSGSSGGKITITELDYYTAPVAATRP